MASTPTGALISGRTQLLFAAIVGVLTVAMASSVVDLAISAAASQANGAQYGFQMMGQLFASTPQFAVLLVLIAAVAALGGFRTLLRSAALAALAFGALLIVLIPFYTLDFLQSRRMVPQGNLKGFTLAGEKTGAFAAWFAVMLLWAGWRAVAASRRAGQSELGVQGRGLVVGQE